MCLRHYALPSISLRAPSSRIASSDYGSWGRRPAHTGHVVFHMTYEMTDSNDQDRLLFDSFEELAQNVVDQSS